MIGYTTVGVKDLASAAEFYDALFDVLGASRKMDFEKFIVWGTDGHSPGFSICTPFDGNAATVGNGTMIALTGDSPETVQQVYQKALEMGGSCEGAPGPRMEGFYAAYFRDRDGNKLNCFCLTE